MRRVRSWATITRNGLARPRLPLRPQQAACLSIHASSTREALRRTLERMSSPLVMQLVADLSSASRARAAQASTQAHIAAPEPDTDAASSAAFESAYAKVRRALDLISQKVDILGCKKRLANTRDELEKEDVWKDPHRMGDLSKEAARLAAEIDPVESLAKESRVLKEMYDMAVGEGEATIAEECADRMVQLAVDADKLQMEILLKANGPADEGNCFVEIQAGAGGRESADWVEMLLRMYTRWAEDKGFRVQSLHESVGEGGGLRSVTVKVDGHLAMGWFRTEAGVHRLVRMSPFDANKKRHTSFAQVRVFPESTSSSSSAVEIPAKDLRIDTYRSQGAGGQSVNTTDSAVRVVHLPTGLVATCQNERSQHRNKAMALDVLRAKLARLQEAKDERERASYVEGLGDNSWGNQIRSYTLQPYQLVKDHRTGVEIGNVTRVLDGDIDELVEGALAAAAVSNDDAQQQRS
uniref:Mitochondrial peptide chain release factor 2 n=1 Tax=Vischeria sp. CAUP Q 202 TaxID=1805947 RepID=A0A140ECK2_9STRA|nr:mitochondrial peptide chain release factor 2 [Vischeria sp. CAUP Q 202]